MHMSQCYVTLTFHFFTLTLISMPCVSNPYICNFSLNEEYVESQILDFKNICH